MQVIGVATKTAMMTAMRNTVADGTIELLSGGGTVLAIIGLSASGGTIAGSSNVAWTPELDAGGVTTGLPAAGSATNAASARIKTAGGTVEETLTLTQTGGGGDVQVDNLSISSGQVVKITSAVINWP